MPRSGGDRPHVFEAGDIDRHRGIDQRSAHGPEHGPQRKVPPAGDPTRAPAGAGEPAAERDLDGVLELAHPAWPPLQVALSGHLSLPIGAPAVDRSVAPAGAPVVLSEGDLRDVAEDRLARRPELVTIHASGLAEVALAEAAELARARDHAGG